MSVEAYRHVEFSLQTGEQKLALAPSEAVPAAQLVDAAGARLEICCVWRPTAEPQPTESYPLGPDGKALARPARCEVQSLVRLDSP
jgi:hypothetical protein